MPFKPVQCKLLIRKNRKLILGQDNIRYSNLIDDCELLTFASFPAPIQRELAYRIVIPGKQDKAMIENVVILRK